LLRAGVAQLRENRQSCRQFDAIAVIIVSHHELPESARP